MIKAGLTSITFRRLSPREIVGLVKRTKLSGIEWGGDVHVPHGDIYIANEIKKMTYGAGVEIPSYGSYYRVGVKSTNNPDFMDVVKSAVALTARVIRVWAGDKGLAQANDIEWRNVIVDSRRIAEIAKDEGIKIAFEYHKNTFNESEEAADKLMKEIDHKNIYSYWQPCCDFSQEEVLSGLKRIAPYLSNLHVFNWIEDNKRRPLSEGEQLWQKYLDIASKTKGERYAFLEFVMGNDVKQFIEDAATLNRIIESTN